MSDPELSPKLADLERRLANRPRIEPPPNLGPRVLAATQTALRRGTLTWRAWAAVAAAVLLGVNLSMSLAADTDWNFGPTADQGTVKAAADRLRTLSPDLPESELRRLTLLTKAASQLIPAADLTLNRNTVTPH